MRLEKTAALLDMARLLAGSAEGLTLDEMALAAGVRRRTAERMRDMLRDLFPGLEEISDSRSKRFRIPGGVDTVFRTPTTDELAELDIAVRTLEQQGGRARAALLRSLSAKIRAMLRAHQRQRIEPDLDALVQGESLVMQAGPKPMVDAALLAVLRDALKASSICWFDYRASNGSDYRREVAPYGILYGRTYYLVGAERPKTAPVLWRLDRISHLERGATFAGPPAGFSLRDFAARSFGAYQEQPEAIVLRFAPEAAAEAQRFDFHPGQAILLEADGSLVVRFEAGGLLELAHHLFSWGETVEIVSPERLRDTMRDSLRRALARHDGTTAPDGAPSRLPPSAPR